MLCCEGRMICTKRDNMYRFDKYRSQLKQIRHTYDKRFGVFCSVFSVVLWSYVTIHIKKLSEQYPPLEVTAVCMGIASVFSLPAAYAYYRISGETLHMTSSLILPILYICLICTALSHFLWNRSLRTYGAAYCTSFYPLQPIVSMTLGVLLLSEPMTAAFLIGLVLIVAAMVIRGK